MNTLKRLDIKGKIIDMMMFCFMERQSLCFVTVRGKA